MSKTPKSLTEAIQEEPERFVKYFDLNKIEKSRNPYKEFLKQFEKEFGKKQGLYLWKYFLDNYKLTNKVYNFIKVQEKVPEEFKGKLDKKVTKEYFDTYKERIRKRQERRDKSIKRKINVDSYTRNGKDVKGYKKTQSQYNHAQEKFILDNRKYSIKEIADKFNNLFDVKRTTFAIRDKRLRLLGRKK